MRHSYRLLGGLALGMVLVTLTAEVLFRLLPVSTATEMDFYIDPLIPTYPARRDIKMSTGWDLRNPQVLRTNNLGFVSDIDFVPDGRAVAVIGDSFVESSMLPYSQRLGAQIQTLLGGQRPVYAMGTPGTSLLDFAERIRFAGQSLHVRDFVVFMHGGDVHESLCGSGSVKGPCLDQHSLALAVEQRTPTSALKKVVRQSALAQYLFSQLKISPSEAPEALLRLPASLLPGSNIGARQPTAPTAERGGGIPPEVIDKLIVSFLERVRPHVTGTLTIVMNSPSPQDKPGPLDVHALRFVELAAREPRVKVVEMAGAFRDHMANSPLSLQVGPYDQHLNSIGLRLVAETAVSAMRAGP